MPLDLTSEIIELIRANNLPGLQDLKRKSPESFNVNNRVEGVLCPLHLAINFGFSDISIWLITEANANINAALKGEKVENYDGFTPLLLAIQKHSPATDLRELVKVLLSFDDENTKQTLNIRAQITLGEFRDYTALMYALHLKKPDLAEIIIRSPLGKQIINTPSANGTTPYKKATTKGLHDIAALLLQAGATIPSRSAAATPRSAPASAANKPVAIKTTTNDNNNNHSVVAAASAALLATQWQVRNPTPEEPTVNSDPRENETAPLLKKPEPIKQEPAALPPEATKQSCCIIV